MREKRVSLLIFKKSSAVLPFYCTLPLWLGNRFCAQQGEYPAPREPHCPWGNADATRNFPVVCSFITGRSTSGTATTSALARNIPRFLLTTDPQTDVARAAKARAAMCVRSVDDQGVLQFTLILAAGCVLHRRTSRVIHRQELFLVFYFEVLLQLPVEMKLPFSSVDTPRVIKSYGERRRVAMKAACRASLQALQRDTEFFKFKKPVSLNRLRWTRELVTAAEATMAGSPKMALPRVTE